MNLTSFSWELSQKPSLIPSDSALIAIETVIHKCIQKLAFGYAGQPRHLHLSASHNDFKLCCFDVHFAWFKCRASFCQIPNFWMHLCIMPKEYFLPSEVPNGKIVPRRSYGTHDRRFFTAHRAYYSWL